MILEVFSCYFQQVQDLPRAKMKPLEFFTFFLFAVAKAIAPEEADVKVERLEQDPRFNFFMKEELGILKQESADFMKTLEFIPSLSDREPYAKCGARRKQPFLNNDCLLISLKLGYWERRLSTVEYFFWMNELENHQKLPSSDDSSAAL